LLLTSVISLVEIFVSLIGFIPIIERVQLLSLADVKFTSPTDRVLPLTSKFLASNDILLLE